MFNLAVAAREILAEKVRRITILRTFLLFCRDEANLTDRKRGEVWGQIEKANFPFAL